MVKTEEDYLKELVAFPSVSADKKASKECARFCAKFFKSYGLHTELIESDGFPNVVATTQTTRTPNILLQCHMDVVPAATKLFDMKKADGRLMGRGTFDMKFACASYMKLVDELADELEDYDFGIMLSFDEEIGGANGVKALLDMGYGAKVCLLPDSGKDWHLEASAHGAWFLKLSKQGKNAHASMPDQGVNAAEILLDAVNEIKKACEEHPKDDLALSLTRMHSGDAMNQIPDYAEAVLDIRFKHAAIYESLSRRIERICQKYKVKTETAVMADCMNVDAAKEEVVDFIRIAEDVLRRKIPTGHSLGATDARFFCARRIPCIVIQPDGGGRHSDDEWVDQAGLTQLTAILNRYIRECGTVAKH